MNTQVNHIKDVEQLIREIANSLVMGIPESKMFLSAISNRLKFQCEDDWMFLCSSLDVIGDTEMAKEDFAIHRLEGNSNGNELGEKYLRLYGILNAIYLQKNAVFKLGEIFQVPNRKACEKKVNALEVCEVRNIVGSHTTEFKDWSEGTKKAFQVSRFHLCSSNIFITDPHNNTREVDLLGAIDDFNVNIQAYLVTIAKKCITTTFKDDMDRKNKYSEILKEYEKDK